MVMSAQLSWTKPRHEQESGRESGVPNSGGSTLNPRKGNPMRVVRTQQISPNPHPDRSSCTTRSSGIANPSSTTWPRNVSIVACLARGLHRTASSELRRFEVRMDQDASPYTSVTFGVSSFAFPTSQSDVLVRSFSFLAIPRFPFGASMNLPVSAPSRKRAV